MSRVGVLLPRKHRNLSDRRLPLESPQTHADINMSVPDNIMWKKAPIPKQFITPDESWDLFLINNPPANQTELEFKQPNPISINPFKLRQEKVAIPVANDVLTKQFLLDRRATRGILNSKQLDMLEILKARKKEKKIFTSLDFRPESTVINANKTARITNSLMNTKF